jgi:D-alanyl-D-alanine carboxypeptidase
LDLGVAWPRDRRFLLLIRIFVCIVASLVSLRAQLSDETTTAVDKLAAKALAESGTPAVSIAIVKDGKVALARAYGDARLDPKTLSAAGMRFSIGSVSKQFLAGAILLAAESGKLSLDDRISKYLPSLTRSNDITIRQLLSHTSGYQDYYPQDYLPRSCSSRSQPKASWTGGRTSRSISNLGLLGSIVIPGSS